MEHKEKYLRQKKKLLSDKSINRKNRELFAEFFDYEEYKLKRINQLSSLDDGCYRTLQTYCFRLKKTNEWFSNKAWKDLNELDIKLVYDNLEDGIYLNQFGKPIKDKKSYYNKIMKAKPFQLAGKDNLVRKIIEFSSFGNNKDETEGVRFFSEEDFRKIVGVVSKIEHKLLSWLAFDIGENVGALLQLRKRDATRQLDENREPEYVINLRRETLKRMRRARSEITFFPETTQLLDLVLKDRNDDDRIFNFELSSARAFFKRATQKTKIKVKPSGDNPILKDLRSSMSCNMLRKGFSRDEVNSRLGHVPSSREIDKYLNFLALDSKKPKKKVQEFELSKVNQELKERKEKERIQNERIEGLIQDVSDLRKQVELLSR